MTIISHCYRQILLDRQIKKFNELCWQEKSQRYGKSTDTYVDVDITLQRIGSSSFRSFDFNILSVDIFIYFIIGGIRH